MNKRIFENVNATGFGRHCLLKYITGPFGGAGAFAWHQNHWQVPALAAVIGEFGYNVDVVEWNAEAIAFDKHYDLLVDISPHNDHVYRQYLKDSCIRILYATGAAPAWQRRQEEARLEYLWRRRGLRLAPQTTPPPDYPSPSEFDSFFLMGNRHTLATFGEIGPAKVFLIKNSGYIMTPPTDFSAKAAGNFLFFASRNQILKGLDLLLDAFASRPHANLFVCSLFQKEPEFCRAYEKELFHTANIKAVGFVDWQGGLFRELARQCTYVILPSCSEGMSGSVLTAMSAGLIPIVSKECGLESGDAHILPETTVECIGETIEEFSRISPARLRAETFRSLEIIRERYNPRDYPATIKESLGKVLRKPANENAPTVIQLDKKRRCHMLANIRVGIALTGGKSWHGGVSYIEALVKSVAMLAANERPQLFLVVTAQSLADLELYRPFIAHFDGVILLGEAATNGARLAEHQPVCCHTWEEVFALIDFYYPVNSGVLPYRQAVSWIPDFQHRYLPEYFSGYEAAYRDSQFGQIAEQASLVIFTSRAVENDFRKFYPQAKAATKVLSSWPMPEESWYRGDPAAVQAKYGLPDRFVLCANQFWTHKNHLTLFRAVGLLARGGHDIHLVCTGRTEDYRSPGYFELLQAEIVKLGIADRITILGHIPREDQLQLLRRSLFVVQPSLFEGLSLIVQECRALGKPLVVSDLAVHIEGGYGTLFDRHNPEDLAAKMAGLLAGGRPGPDMTAEAQAREIARREAEKCGREFCSLVLEHLGYAGRPPAAPPGVTIVTSLVRGNIANQQAALASWRQLGFKVVAVNSPADIAALRPDFPDLEFIPAYRDATAKYGKSYIYFHDLVEYCRQQPTAVWGIVKSDIILRGDGLVPFIAKEAAGAVVFGARVDVDEAGVADGSARSGGFDYLFFDSRAAACYPPEDFCFGLYWWDYWAVIMAIAGDVPAKWLVSPVAYHVKHAVTTDLALWHKLGSLLARYAETDYAVTGDTIAAYQQLLFCTIKDNSAPLTLTVTAPG